MYQILQVVSLSYLTAALIYGAYHIWDSRS